MSDQADGQQPTGSAAPPPATAPASPSWPSSAKSTSAVLAVVAVAAVILAIIGFSQSSDDDDDAADDAPAEVVDDATDDGELDAAVERAEAAEAERDVLADEVAAAESTITDLTGERDEAVATNEQLTASLTEAERRAEEAEARVAEIEEVAGQFPIQLDSSLIPEDMPGTYSIAFQEAYCDPGFVLCGTAPQGTLAEIYYDENEFLRIRVDGVLDAGLFALDGSLYGITDTVGSIPSCSGADRRARITVTMFAGSVSVLDDGTRVVNDVQATINRDAPPDGEGCPGGIQFFASTLTKQG